MHSSEAEIVQQDKQKYLISGAVDFSTVPDLLRQSKKFLQAAKPVNSKEKPEQQNLLFDMSQITDCNSAGLALMLEIINSARNSSISVHFEKVPDTLLTIAKAYGIENEIKDMCIREICK